MRPYVSWMSDVDRLILEWLDETGIAAPPKVIYLNLVDEYGDEEMASFSQINRRIRDPLPKHGLVERAHEDRAQGYYRITELGRRYLHDSDAAPEEFVADDEEPE